MGGCRYQLNRRDQIIEVDDGWLRCAKEAGDSDLLPARILRRSLWEFIADPRTRLLQGALLRKVRSTRKPIRLPFRCDSPEMKRWMEMELTSSAGGEVDVTTSVVRTEPRARIACLAPHESRSPAEILNCCGWCNAVRVGDGPWQEVEELLCARPGWPASDDSVELRHQLCPRCDATLVKASS